jgi:tRNA threonylcarbamoyladenosine biosynthesis protein TsaE
MTALVVVGAEQMRELGRRLAAQLVAGDLVVLSGPLGAGKTTFIQGVAQGLQVQGAVTSPTFVIARVHRALAHGPDLVHVDAYRLSSLSEVDDLDLDASMEDSVTVVEWGDAFVAGLARNVDEARPVRRVEIARDVDLPENVRSVHLFGFVT